MSTVKIKLQDKQGKEAELKLGMSLYKRAAEQKIPVRLAIRYAAAEQGLAWDPSKGDLLDQAFANSGLLNGSLGGRSYTMADLSRMELADGFRRPDQDESSLGARLLFPQFVLETFQENALKDDGTSLISVWNSMIGINTNVDTPRVIQPTINTSGPEESRSGHIAQLAEPETIVSITTGERSVRIPTKAIGLLISDEAQKETSIDLVRLVLEAQARGERIRRIHEQLNAMIIGDDDLGMEALSGNTASEFNDGSVTGLTKKAYIKWLVSLQSKANFSMGILNVDTAFDLDGLMSVSAKSADPGLIKTPFAGVNLNLTTPTYSVLPEVATANQIIVLDPRYAIQRYVNVNAAYDAVEEYVMRKATGFRIDYGEVSTRLYDDAWGMLTYS